MYTNIMGDDKATNTIEQVVRSLSYSLAKSLGPFGAPTLIEGRQLDHHMTKDGYTILKGIRFNEPMANVILEIIRDAAFQLVSEVGDGSTSTIISADAFYNKLKTVIEKTNFRPKDIVDTVNKCITIVNEKLDTMVRRIDPNDTKALERIAVVALNNNEEDGKLVREIYDIVGTEGFITVKMGSKVETTYTKTEGFQLNAGYLDSSMANSDSAECVLNKPMILMFDNYIGDEFTVDLISKILEDINKAMKADKFSAEYQSLLVIAPSFGEIAKQRMMYLNTLYRSAHQPINYNFISYNLGTEHSINVYNDLSVMLGAEIIKNSMGQHLVLVNQELRLKAANYENVALGEMKKEIDESDRMEPEAFAGTASKVVSTARLTTFLGTEEDEKELAKMQNKLRADLKDLTDRGVTDLNMIYSIKKRLAILNKSLVTIYVGGNTEQEKLANKDLFDDAIAACRSALDHGYVIGGNLSIVIAINKIFKDYQNCDVDKKVALQLDIFTAMQEAFISVYKTVLSKGITDEIKVDAIVSKSIGNECIYDLIAEDYSKDSVINSVMTEQQILKNVANIIALLLTCNQFITVNPITEITE